METKTCALIKLRYTQLARKSKVPFSIEWRMLLAAALLLGLLQLLNLLLLLGEGLLELLDLLLLL